MAQSEQDLYREIVKEYKAAVKEDSRIEALKKRLESEKTTTAAAWEYGDAAGSDLEKAFLEKAKEIVDSEDGYKAVKKALKAGYDDVCDYTADVLSGQNKKAGIGMKGTPADFEDVRSTASAISNKISNAETVEECENYIREEVKTFTNNAVGDTIRETARMSESQGMSPKIERSASSTACQYCLGLAGSYVYPCDREVFTRHANCDCVVEYQPVKGARKIVSSSTVRQNKNSLSPEERERRAEEGLYRKQQNTGLFSKLEEPMQLRHVKAILKDIEVDYSGVKIHIDRDVNLIGSPFCGYTYDSADRVILYPEAFRNRETLVKTLGHEGIHLEQYRKNGKIQGTEDAEAREYEAVMAEQGIWEKYIRRTRYEK